MKGTGIAQAVPCLMFGLVEWRRMMASRRHQEHKILSTKRVKRTAPIFSDLFKIKLQ